MEEDEKGKEGGGATTQERTVTDTSRSAIPCVTVGLLHCTALDGSVLCHVVLCCAVLCCAVLCCAVRCCAVLCSAVLGVEGGRSREEQEAQERQRER